ncbi:MAG: hypothetical protein IMF19_04470 [Proteobacteria bacterium]|nr:hypothetical protein [Pseudomonadota bacterium]
MTIGTGGPSHLFRQIQAEGTAGRESLASEDQILKTLLYVWNVDTLAWERMEQPMLELSGDITVTMGDVERLLAEYYWLKFKYDYDGNGNCIYKGKNVSLSAADGDTDWYITRYDYTDNDCTEKRVRITSWTNRAAGW